ncbi:hypothetical protein AKO1_012522 [Acrasis kona]|uniref:Uncharacterized protein n=1 Tax=Acrasis kona TaxID=1008807 RepID=A0AAW2YXG8_9EUKA
MSHFVQLVLYDGTNPDSLVSEGKVVDEYRVNCKEYISKVIEEIRNKRATVEDELIKIIDNNVPVPHRLLLQEPYDVNTVSSKTT